MIPVTVTFYGDVGFDRSYMNVIDFETTAQRDAYFNPRIVKTIQNCAYNKPMNSLQIVCDYSDALAFTYCKFNIGSKTGKGKEIYAWVDDVAVVTDQPNEEGTTYNSILSVNISVDPWQTFLFDFSLGESFVAREHRDRFKVNDDGTRGWTLGNTSDKSNVGLEKRATKLSNLTVKHNFEMFIMGAQGQEYNTEMYFMCIQHSHQGGAEIRITLVPFALKYLRVGSYDGLVFKNGACLRTGDIFDGSYLSTLNIGSDYVSSVTFIPFDCYDYNGYKQVADGNVTYNVANISLKYSNFKAKTVTFSNVDILYFEYETNLNDMELPLSFSFEHTLYPTGLTQPTDNVYSITHEPQLYKQPYRYVSVVDINGGEKGCLPDIMANVPNQTFTVVIYLLIDSVDVRVRIVPKLPNDIKLDSAYWIEYSLPYVDVVSTHWLNYMLQQRDADRAMIQSQINQNAISGAIGGVSSGVNMGANQAMSIGKAQAGGSKAAAGMSELGGFAAGVIVGLGVGAISTIGGYMADTYFCFEQQDIREKAIKRKANNVISSGTFKSMVANTIEFYLMKCDETTIDIKSKEFHKYGYSVFAYETPDVKSRKYFNYIATSLVKIEGSLNNDVKMALAQIFNTGVTIWHGDYISELSGIGDYSKENIERRLI